MLVNSLNLLQYEDEDVILEGSDLHKALVDMGFNNFDSIPRAETNISIDTEPTEVHEQSVNSSMKQKFYFISNHFCQEKRFTKKQLTTILEADILLDDHASAVHDLFNEQGSKLRLLDWFPLGGSLLTATFCSAFIKKNSMIMTATGLLLVFFSYKKFKHWMAIRNLNHLVILQNKLHEMCKKSLKILRLMWAKKFSLTEIHEKQELIGNKKWNIIIAILQLLVEIFSNLSNVYYQCASDILNHLPNYLLTNCILTEINIEKKESNLINKYDDLKSLYYTFILVQSEMMLILAHAYNGKAQNKFFSVPNTELSTILKKLNKSLSYYQSKLSKLLFLYEQCEVKPVRRVFRGIPNSKWQDTYIHLDLTSHRIQLAYKEITSILEYIDTKLENDENSVEFIESITEKMNEAYKQIENARSFAEFSSLLIAKAQRKPVKDTELENDGENLFPPTENNKIIMSIDDQLEIEDEVFEEYIKEEYLKPLYESSEGTMESFKIDKLLKKNFMSELKDALIEKQKTMSERELKALKRMYNKIQKDSSFSKTEIEKNEELLISSQSGFSSENKLQPPLPLPREIFQRAPPPPPPLPPPRPLAQTVVAENDVKEDEVEQKVSRHPIPFPRFKTLQPEDDIPDVQRFSIKECTPRFKFPPNFKIEEETFLGSGENSEIEDENESDSRSDLVEGEN